MLVGFFGGLLVSHVLAVLLAGGDSNDRVSDAIAAVKPKMEALLAPTSHEGLFINTTGIVLARKNASVPSNDEFPELRIGFDVKKCVHIFLDLRCAAAKAVRLTWSRVSNGDDVLLPFW